MSMSRHILDYIIPVFDDSLKNQAQHINHLAPLLVQVRKWCYIIVKWWLKKNKKTNMKSFEINYDLTASHIRDISNLLSTINKHKVCHFLFVRQPQLPETHSWLACWQCCTTVKFIYCSDIYQPLELNIINDNIYMKNIFMGLQMNTRNLYNFACFLVKYSDSPFFFFFLTEKSDVQLSRINSLSWHVTVIFSRVGLAKHGSCQENFWLGKTDWKQEGIMPKRQLE